MTTSQTISLSCAETAQLLRKALKETLPTITFSIRSHTYAGGTSIDVKWTDGPASQQVQRICNRFVGATFDGMTDVKSYQTHIVNGQYIQYGADFIHAQRRLSVAFLTTVAQAYCARHRCTVPPILEHSTGAYISQTSEHVEAIMRLSWATSEAAINSTKGQTTS
jgi:hypothetical protein